MVHGSSVDTNSKTLNSAVGIWRKIPFPIWMLSLVSLLMNISSVFISSLAPVFILQVLGGTAADVGYMRGIADAVSYIVKLFSGVVSDYIGKRKSLIVIGYAIAAVSKLMFAFCTTKWFYMSTQFIERFANGLRDTPRDAMVADYAPAKMQGVSFGIRQAMAHIGSILGTILCYFAMSWTQSDIRLVYFVAFIPAIIAVICIILFIQDSKLTPLYRTKGGFPITMNNLRQLGGKYWSFIISVLILLCVRFNDQFLILQAVSNCDISAKYHPLILLVSYCCNAPTTKITGLLVDRYPKKYFIYLGIFLFIASCYILSLSNNNIGLLLLGTGLYGAHFGILQTVFNTTVAELAPKHLIGTAFGIFNICCAITTCVANGLAGFLWTQYGCETVFHVAGGIATIALLTFMCL